MLGEVGYWPALMVATGCTIGTYMPSPQDSAQTLPYPTVEWLEDGVLAVLEVFKPTGRAAIEFPDDVSHASGSAALGLFSYGCFELFQALLARPAIASFEVVAQKVETAFLAGIDDARFGWVQRQSRRLCPLAQLLHYLLGFRFGLAQDDEVVSVAHHLPPLLCHHMVQWVEVNVCQ